MLLNVTNEVGRLKSVLVHLPGREIDMMIPSMMGQLLFDDILFGQVAREEHRRFQQIIYYVADHVYDLQDLLEETFEDAEVRAEVLRDVRKRYRIRPKIFEWLQAQTPASLAEAMIGGLSVENQDQSGATPKFYLPPVPNLFFMRDPQTVIGDRVAINAMASDARGREPYLSRLVFRYHKAFRGRDDVFWLDRDEGEPVKGRTIIVVELPKKRSYMHLDTVFTPTSTNECLVYPPVMLPGGAEEAVVYSMDLTKKNLSFSRKDDLFTALSACGIDLKPILCGGTRPIDQQREQWTDGANAFALAPGIILLYERNVRTAEELSRNGYHIVYEDDLLLGRTELETWTDKKYAIQIQGHEISRARGGPHCMTMPLEREEI